MDPDAREKVMQLVGQNSLRWSRAENVFGPWKTISTRGPRVILRHTAGMWKSHAFLPRLWVQSLVFHEAHNI